MIKDKYQGWLLLGILVLVATGESLVELLVG
jgi:hypothetical protein